MNNYKTDGVIIKRTNWGEADRLLTVMTPYYGKIRLVAKGVRKITSKRASSLELFNHTSFVIHRGRTSHYVSSVMPRASFEHIRGDLKHVAAAYQLCELVGILTREDQEVDGVYDLLLSSLQRLDSGMNFSLPDFKHKLLLLLGFASENVDYDIDSYIEEIAQRRLLAKRLYE
jgi:DNA repair protein RecO (recombination protein O)